MSENKTWTTYWFDFTTAEALNKDAVRPAYNKAFAEAKHDYKLLAELVCVLLHKVKNWETKNRVLAVLYNQLCDETVWYALDTLAGEELDYYFEHTV